MSVEIITIDEMLDDLKENIDNELESQGLGSWTIDASGQNFADHFNGYTLEDLHDLKNELAEGTKMELKIDISDAVYEHITGLIDDREAALLDEDDDDLDYQDYDDDEDGDY